MKVKVMMKINDIFIFNWYSRIIVEDDVIVFHDSSKYEIHNTTGAKEDNLGNYDS